MKKLMAALWVAAPFLGLCSIGHCEVTNAPLTFYMVSKQEIEGGRLFDRFPFPKLGYIAPRPDLIVTHLKAMSLQEKPDYPVRAEDKASGRTWKATIHPVPRLFFTLLDEDATRLKALTEQAVDQKLLLVMFGEKPLSLMRVADFAESPTFEVAHNSTDEWSLRKTADDLKQLLQPSLR